MAEHYDVYRDKNGKPRLVVCHDNSNPDIPRSHEIQGVAICSNDDTPNMDTGILIARGRFLKAQRLKKSTGQISGNNAIAILNECLVDKPWIFKFNSYYGA